MARKGAGHMEKSMLNREVAVDLNSRLSLQSPSSLTVLIKRSPIGQDVRL
jgi:hypothetical protein